MWIRMGTTAQALVTLVTVLSSAISTEATGKTDYVCIQQYYKVNIDELQKATVTPSERQFLTMDCSEGQAIAVDNITVKRTKCLNNDTCCPDTEDPVIQCDVLLWNVRRQCNGEQHCEIDAAKRRNILKACRRRANWRANWRANYDYVEVKYTCTNANLTQSVCDNFIGSSYLIHLTSPNYPSSVTGGQHLCTCTMSSMKYFNAYFTVLIDVQSNDTSESGRQTLSAAGRRNGKGNWTRVFHSTNVSLNLPGFHELNLTFHSNLTADAGSFYIRLNGKTQYPGLIQFSNTPIHIECTDLLQTSTVYPANSTTEPKTGAVTGLSDVVIGAAIGSALAVIVIILLVILIVRFKKRYGSWKAFKTRRGRKNIPITVSATDGEHENMVGDHESKYLTMDSSNKNRQESTKYVDMENRKSADVTYENVPTNDPNQTINKKCASTKAVSKKKPTIKPKPKLGGKPPVKPKPKFFKKSDKKDKRVSEVLYEIPEDPSRKTWTEPGQEEYYIVPGQERYEQLRDKTHYQDPDVYTSLDNDADVGIYEN